MGEALTRSAITSHRDMFHRVLKLQPGASVQLDPPDHHDVARAFVFEGEASVQGERSPAEVLVFDGPGSIDVRTASGACVLRGTARRHLHALVLGSSSIHTDVASLHHGHAWGRRFAMQGACEPHEPCRRSAPS